MINSPELKAQRILKSSSNITFYGLTTDLRFTHFGGGWHEFSRQNNGPDEQETRTYVGVHLSEIVPPLLFPFYAELFTLSRNTQGRARPLMSTYECPSPDRMRVFRMIIQSLGRDGGFITHHVLTEDRPLGQIDDLVGNEHIARYVNSEGRIMHCGHCRRAERGDTPGRWSTIPMLIGQWDPRIQHTLCPRCHDKFFPVDPVSTP